MDCLRSLGSYQRSMSLQDTFIGTVAGGAISGYGQTKTHRTSEKIILHHNDVSALCTDTGLPTPTPVYVASRDFELWVGNRWPCVLHLDAIDILP